MLDTPESYTFSFCLTPVASSVHPGSPPRYPSVNHHQSPLNATPTAHPRCVPEGSASRETGPLVLDSVTCFCVIFNNVGDENVLLQEKEIFRHIEKTDPITLMGRTMRQ